MEEIRALFIGAHEDECEYGPGGAAYLLARAGVRTRFYNACALRKSMSPEELAEKTEAAVSAARVLGAEKTIESPSAPVWVCSEEHVEHILQEILSFRPQLVFLHYPRDTHSEHRELARASYQALCLAPAYGWHVSEVYAFEAGPDQTVQYMTPDFVVDITDVMLALQESFSCFGEGLCRQLYEEKTVGASLRGLKSGFAYGEAFKIIKYPNGGEDFLLRRLLGPRFQWFGNEYYPAHGDLYF